MSIRKLILGDDYIDRPLVELVKMHPELRRSALWHLLTGTEPEQRILLAIEADNGHMSAADYLKTFQVEPEPSERKD